MWGAQQNTQADAAGAMVEVQAPVDAEASAKTAGREPSPAPLPGAEAPGAEGAAEQAMAPIPDEKAQAFWRGKLAAANLANAVALFLRSPAHRHYTLADLEWCLLPALARGQFMVAEAKLPDGQAVPAALVLWARVSVEVDARLSAAPRYPIRLHPNEWQSGDVIWIVDAVGEPKAAQQCIETLTMAAFHGRQFKMLLPNVAPKRTALV
jgi:hemolysin-activating ACP:hemolysin acyltransferase